MESVDTLMTEADDSAMHQGTNYEDGDDESHHGAAMTQRAQKERRNSIREIMADEFLTPLEKRRNIQSLMDGRRRSSASHGSTGSETADRYRSDNEDSHAPYPYNYYNQNGATTTDNEYYGYHVEHSRNQQRPLHQAAVGGEDDDNASQSSDAHRLQSMDANASGRRKQQRSSSMPLWSEDTTRAAAPLVAASSNAIWDDPMHIAMRMEKSRPPCGHYERNCTIISPCCGLAFGCRICHDECPVLPMPFAKRPPPPPTSPVNSKAAALGDEQSSSPPADGETLPQERILNWQAVEKAKHKQEKRRSMPMSYDEYIGEETHHEIDRFAIAEIICRLCYTRQSSKTNFCTPCGAQFGAYHCNICNLWMADDEEPYHCEDCGFCRVGGRDNFRHCHDCGMCIDTLLFDDHNCKAGKYMSNCPVCQEDLFSSRDASHEMPCGHAIHWHCFKELTSYDTRCPVCKKTAETPEHMGPTWQAMALGIALQPVPPELARVVSIQCIDCEAMDENRRWHFLGVRCNHCSSFNTTVERTSLTGREAAAYLDELDQALGSQAEGGIRPMDAS